MKYLSILLLSLFILSCCGTKKIIETQPEPMEEVAVVTEVPDDKEIENELEVESEEIPETTELLPPPEPPILEEVDVIDHYYVEEFDHTRWNTLLQKNVSDDGNVNYKAYKNNRTELQVYIDSLTENMPTENWHRDDKLAYWINAYNALTIDLIIRNYPLKSIKDIKEPWDQRIWKFGDKWLNLNDIEHKILRKMNEPRIHFAIVCASVSCPKLQNTAFTASNLDEQLTNATKEFLADNSKNEISQNNLRLSKIFKWFKKDFEQNGTLIEFLNQYAEVSISSKAKKSYKDYNWDLND